MSNSGDDQTFHSPGPHSRRPAGLEASALETRGGSLSLGTTGTQDPAGRALTGGALPEGAIAGSDRQTCSKGQAIPVCLGPLDKPFFDERFAAPTVDRQFIEGPKEQKSSEVVSALEHIVRSARKHRTESRVNTTPQVTAASPNSNLPYPIGTRAFYSTDERSRRIEEGDTAREWSTGQASSSVPARGASCTPHSPGTPHYLRNPGNLPGESTVGLVTPTIVGGVSPPLETPARPLAGGLSLASPEKKRKEKVSNRGANNQGTTESQVWEKTKFTPYKLVWDKVGNEEAESFEYLSIIEDDGIEVIDSEGSNEKTASDERESISPQQAVNPDTEQNSKVNPDPNDRQEPENSQESEGEYETDRVRIRS